MTVLNHRDDDHYDSLGAEEVVANPATSGAPGCRVTLIRSEPSTVSHCGN
jgi:hypothetical protein